MIGYHQAGARCRLRSLNVYIYLQNLQCPVGPALNFLEFLRGFKSGKAQAQDQGEATQLKHERQRLEKRKAASMNSDLAGRSCLRQ